MKIGGKEIKLRPGAWILLPALVLAWITPPSSPSNASTVITNGGFDGSTGWTIVQNGGSGMVFNGVLRFSYMTGEVSQSFAVNPGDAIEVSFTVDNSSTNSVGRGAISDTWNSSLVAGGASATTGRTVAHNQETFTLSLTVPSGVSSATLSFSGMDNGFWAGVYGPIVGSVSATITPAPKSLLVTSLADDGSEGTLRWAINQANAASGGIYDSIAIMTEGTITLTANLPSITQSVSITGAGMAKTIIDGNNQYRSIYNNGTRDISISNLTFKKGANATGGIVWANNGTFTVTNVKFTESQNYAWYQQNNTVTTFELCQFTNLAYAIRSDYGSTPSAKSDDSAYGNRIYIKNSQFSNNSYGLATERFVKIEDSTFSNNTVAAQMQGLNRIQVYGSTFNNNGTAIYIFSWIPTSWTPGADNQIIQGSTFTENSNAINFNNYFSNGTRVVNGNNSNLWSTARSNSYSENATIYGGSGFIEDSNTVVTTTTSTTTTSTTTTSTVPPKTDTEPENTTTTEPEPEPEITTTIPLPDTGTTSSTVEETNTTMETVPETIPITEEENVGQGDSTESTVQDSIPEPEAVPQDETPTQETPPELPLDTSEAIEQINTASLSSEELADAVDSVLQDVSSPEEFGAAISDILDKPLTDEQFNSVLETIFSEPLSDEQFNAAISSIIDSDLSAEQFTEVIGILEGDSVTEEQVSSAVDSIIENGITEDQATELATSEKVLESISADVAAEIFNEIPVDELSDEQGQQIVDAVQNAPTEIKEAFEEEINIFDGAFDTYVPTGSSVSVGERRTIVAVTVVSSVIAISAAPAPPAPSGPSGSSSGPSGSGPGGSDPSGGSEPKEGKSKNKSRGRRRK